MSTYSETYEIVIPKQSVGEEIANSATHALGCLLSVAATIALVYLSVRRQVDGVQLAGLIAYGLSLIGVYGASTLSHAIQEPRQKHFFRIVDQALIYCLIAGTYTPFILACMPEPRKWVLIVVVWGLAAAGFFSKTVLRHRIGAVTVSNYILLGWVPAAAMLNLMPLACVSWMAVGGVLYTVGALFLCLDQRVPYFHAMWHLFVLSASAAHYYAVAHFIVMGNI